MLGSRLSQLPIDAIQQLFENISRIVHKHDTNHAPVLARCNNLYNALRTEMPTEHARLKEFQHQCYRIRGGYDVPNPPNTSFKLLKDCPEYSGADALTPAEETELTADDRARFNNYVVQLDIFKKERSMSQAEFDGIICEIFERLNSGKPLTDNDKYWNRKETPAMQLLNRLKSSSEFGPLIRKYMWPNLGGGKGRSGLNHFIGLILGLINARPECISTSFMQNGPVLMNTAVDEAGEGRVTDFLRWYFGLLTDVFQFTELSVKRVFGKLSRVGGMIAMDWIRSTVIARGHYNMWKRYIELQCSRANFERRIFAELPNGLARNVTEIAINARIDAVITAYHHDEFAEYNQDAFQIVLGSDDESGDD